MAADVVNISGSGIRNLHADAVCSAPKPAASPLPVAPAVGRVLDERVVGHVHDEELASEMSVMD
jgi:hypothetical protein